MRFSKIIVSLGMTFLLFAGSITVNAVDVVQIPKEDIDTVYNQSIQSNAIEGWATGPQIYSEAGIVMDIDSGAILYAKNIDNPHYPASITKILTGLVALENNELTDIVTVTVEDYNFLERGDNHIGLKNGEEITMEDALHGTLLASGNEVAHALGSNTEGGYDNFIQLMNQKAKELGCTNSNFVNSHGLHDDNHYTSARDMALIGAAAFQNEDFRRIIGTKLYTIPVTNITNETRSFENHHKMLFDWRSQYYEYCVGGKTGYTDDALNTLVTFATKDDVNLVAVVLRNHGSGNVYVDTRAMLDYAFENFAKLAITADMITDKNVKAVENGAYVMLPVGITYEQLDYSVEMPTEIGDRTGTLTYTYEGQAVGKVVMTITEDSYNELHGIEKVKEENAEKKEKQAGSTIPFVIKIVIGVIAAVAIVYIILLCYVAYKRKKIQEQRHARRMQWKREMEAQKYVEQMKDTEN